MALALEENRHHWSALPPRLALGSTMLFHGASKLRGEGPRQTQQFFGQIGIRRPKFWAVATGIAELAAGAMALLGFGTRLGALAVLTTQAVAVRKVHLNKGFDIMKGGFEYNLALMAIAAALLINGPGRYSTHELLERRLQRSRLSAWIPRTRRRRALRLVKLLK